MTRLAIAALVLLAAAWTPCGAAEGLPADFHPPYDHRQYGKAFSVIFSSIFEEDFAQLDAMYGEFLKPDARTADGTWMMQAFQDVFEASFRFQPPAKVERIFRDWKARDPDSPLRPIAEAYAWEQRAWVAKGSGCYAQRPPSSRGAFNHLLERSATALREAEPRGKDSPLWHTLAIFVAGGQGRAPAELDGLLDEAARRFPSYVPIYSARMTFLMPEWGGDFDRVDKFVRESVERTRAAEGRGFYAWLYLDITLKWGCERLFEDSKVDWPEMKTAFEDMLERHPDVWNRNAFATFACRARDEETTARLLGELGKDAKLGVGSRSISTESCWKMLRRAPEPAKSALATSMRSVRHAFGPALLDPD